MKQQIRRGVFETNSSSTHVIAIQKDNVLDNPSLGSARFEHAVNRGYNVEFIVYAKSFGWDHVKYYQDVDKIMYLLIAMCAIYSKEEYDEKYNLMLQWLNDVHIKICIPKFIDETHTYKDREGNEHSYCERGFLEEEFANGFRNLSYIDHTESLHEFVYYVMEDKNHFYNFIFGKKSYIETGNDNEGTFSWIFNKEYASFDEMFQDCYGYLEGEERRQTYNKLKSHYTEEDFHVVPEGVIEFYKGN